MQKKESCEIVWGETTNELLLYVTKDKNNLNDIIMGFCLDLPQIEPNLDKYNTIVYRVKKFYPHDENPNDFCFDLDNGYDLVP